VSCLPFKLNAEVAAAAAELGVHYLDLTEDRATSDAIRTLARDARSALIPHCGTAPGFVCSIAATLAQRLDRADRVALRVGALPQSPNGAFGYAFNWSAEGVVNLYVSDCEILRDGRRTNVPALSDREPLVLDGTAYEAFATSGGLGTMCETFEGRIDWLDYKTIRYPGHCELARFLFHELRMDRHPDQVREILLRAYPPVEDDVLLLYVAAQGQRDGRSVREEFVRVYRPRDVAGRRRTAVTWVTAAGVASVVQLLATGLVPASGLVLQEDIPSEELRRTAAGALLA
jgi:saccharopine dehydrogenase (NAD+, L-lysine-forming)